MRWRTRLTALLGILFLLAATLADAQDAKQDPKAPPFEPNYYPLQVGNQWTFRVTVGDSSTIATSRIAKIETMDDVPMARLEASVNGNVVATEHLAQNKDGVFRYRNNALEITPPICLLKYPVVPGAKWDGDITVGKDKGKYSCETKEEAVEVTAGKYQAMRVTIKLESKGQNVTTTYWFVKDIGFVKQTVGAGDLNITMELEKFEKAKVLPK